MHNRQAEIAVLAICGFVACVAGLAAVSAGTNKPSAECVPIVQKHGGLSVYQALGRTDAAVPPKQVERQFGDVVLQDDRIIALSCRPHHRNAETGGFRCRNQQCCLHFWLLLEDPFEQLSGIVKNVDRHGKPALFLIIPDSCLRIIQAKTKAVRRRKSVNNATISYISGKVCAGCMKAFCRITAASAGSIPKQSMAGCKVAGRSQKQPAPSGRQYTELCV